MLLVEDVSQRSGVSNDLDVWTPGGVVRTSPLTTPLTTTSGDVLTTLSCVTPTFCLALGTYDVILGGAQRILAEVWNGKGWRLTPSPSEYPHFDMWLTAVECTAVNHCVAAGGLSPDVGSNPTGQFLGAVWNGSQWSVSQPQPDPGSVPVSTYYSQWTLSCPSAVCQIFIGAKPVLWTPGGNAVMEISPYTAPNEGHVAHGISCTADGFCMLVGDMTDPAGHTEATTNDSYGVSGSGQADGAGWSSHTGVGFSGSASWTLAAVSCTESDDCVAVGSVTKSGTTGMLAEQWNGTKWRPIPTGISEVTGSLTSVSCLTLAFCAAAGEEGSAASGIVAIWDGASWTVHSVPGTRELSAISCVLPSTCLAAGSSGAAPALIEWSGSSAKSIPLGTDAASGGSFDGVSCVKGPTCMVVGNMASGTATVPISEFWTGGALKPAVISPTQSGSSTILHAVACIAADACYAVGNTAASQDARNSVFAWNGSAWSQEIVADQSPTTEDSLSTVTCAAAQHCVAAGSYIKEGVSSTFLVRLIPAHAEAAVAVLHRTKLGHGKSQKGLATTGITVLLVLLGMLGITLVLLRRKRRRKVAC